MSRRIGQQLAGHIATSGFQKAACLQAKDALTGQQVAVKIMYRAELSALQQHAVLRGCAVHAKCCEAGVPHILPFFCALQVCSTG